VSFKGIVSEESETIFDRFDALPPVGNIIAYSGDEPIGTMRINLDAGVGLPPDDSSDFTEYRERIVEQWMRTHSSPPRFGSAGMLAIRSDWRNRRDVIHALLKMGAGVGQPGAEPISSRHPAQELQRCIFGLDLKR